MRIFHEAVCCAVLTLCIVLFLKSSTLRGEDETIESFKSKAPTAWSQYLEALKNIEVIRYTEDTDNDGIKTFGPTTVYHSPPYHLSISQIDGIVRGARGNNKRYSFTLRSEDGKTWNIDLVEQFLPNGDDPLMFLKPGEMTDGKVLRDLASWDTMQLAVALKLNCFIWFPSYVNEEDFQVLEVENLYEDDLHLVRVKYSYEPKEFNPNIPLRSGEVFLLPDYHWVIKRAAYEGVDPDQSQVHCQTEIEYDLTPGKLALPSVATVKVAANKYNITSKYYCTWKEGCKFDKKMFTLSHFGLPEPDFGEGRVNRLRILTSLVGCVVILLSLYKIYQKRRRQS